MAHRLEHQLKGLRNLCQALMQYVLLSLLVFFCFSNNPFKTHFLLMLARKQLLCIDIVSLHSPFKLMNILLNDVTES